MYTLGIDIGSTTSKCVVMKDGNELVAKSLQIGGLGTSGPENALEDIWKITGLSEDDIKYTIATGYGRINYKKSDGEISELTCHAIGGRYIFPELRTVIDIGGQDAKVICLSKSGRMTNFVMNDKCAAGTGRFLDVMASILRIGVGEMETYAMKSDKPASISSTCTVFAESEVISQMANGTEITDLVAGICESVAARVSALARRAGVKEQVCMSGGVANNKAIRKAMEQRLDVKIEYDPLAQYFGAIGAALWGYRQVSKDNKSLAK